MTYKSKKTIKNKEVCDIKDNESRDVTSSGPIKSEHTIPHPPYNLPTKVNAHYRDVVTKFKQQRCDVASKVAGSLLVKEVKDVDVSLPGLTIVYTVFLDVDDKEVWLLKNDVGGWEKV